MQLKTQINLSVYFTLTLTHFGISLYLFGIKNLAVLSLLFLAIVFNQVVLVLMVRKMVHAEEEDGMGAAGMVALVVLKLLTLVGALYYGMLFFEGNNFTIIGNYIIQLIIFVISNKRYKYNK